MPFLGLFKLIPLKDWLYIGVFVAIFGGYVWFVHHERAIGDARCEARIAAVQEQAQAAADKAAATANAQIHTNIDAITANLPDYLRAYGDKSKATDCPDVTYVRKLRGKR